jgi:hypothetical protein
MKASDKFKTSFSSLQDLNNYYDTCPQCSAIIITNLRESINIYCSGENMHFSLWFTSDLNHAISYFYYDNNQLESFSKDAWVFTNINDYGRTLTTIDFNSEKYSYKDICDIIDTVNNF